MALALLLTRLCAPEICPNMVTPGFRWWQPKHTEGLKWEIEKGNVTAALSSFYLLAHLLIKVSTPLSLSYIKTKKKHYLKRLKQFFHQAVNMFSFEVETLCLPVNIQAKKSHKLIFVIVLRFMMTSCFLWLTTKLCFLNSLQ